MCLAKQRADRYFYQNSAKLTNIVASSKHYDAGRTFDGHKLATPSRCKIKGGRPCGRAALFSSSTAINLLSCFYPRRDQTDVVDPGLVPEIDDLSYFAEVEVFVAFDEHNLLLARRKDFRQLGFNFAFV